MTPVIFIFLLYLFHTTGELCLSPVGLSAMNRLAPKHLASLIMGTWFFASAIGNFAAGVIASATGSEEKLKELEKLSEAAKPAAGAVAEAGAAETAADLAAQTAIAGKQVVLEVYTQIGWLTILVGVGVLVVSPLIKKLMHLDTLKNDTEAAAH